MNKKNIRFQKGNKKYFIPFVIIFICLISLVGLYTYKTNRYYVKVGNISITKEQYDVFYYMSLHEFQEAYEYYLDYMSLDINGDLSSQYINDNITLQDYIISETDMSIYEILSLSNKANDNNFECNADEVCDQMMDIMKTIADVNNMTLKAYIKYEYGKNLTESKLREVIYYQILSKMYYESLASIEISDEEYEIYYDSHQDELDEVEFLSISLPNTEENTETLEEIKSSIITKDEFIEKAIELKQNDGYVYITGFSNCKDIFAEWLFNAENNSMKVFSDKNYVYLLYKIDRHRNNSPTRNIYNLQIEIIDEDKDIEYYEMAKEALEKYNQSDKTEENFITIMNEYTNTDLRVENIVEDNISELLSIWLFNDNRIIGDTEIIKSGNIYYVIYYDGYGMETYKAMSKSAILDEKMNNILADIIHQYTYLKR